MGKMPARLVAAAALAVAASAPSFAQRAGVGGTGVSEASAVPTCAVPLGVVALVESKAAADPMDQLPPGMAALVRMAEAQNGGGATKVDIIPLLQMLVSKSNCFRVVDRGQAFSALERERQLAGAPPQQLKAADYLLQSRLIFSDAKSRESGGGFGTLGAGILLKSKTAEAQIGLDLVEVRTGLQVAIASGSARKRDLGIAGGGLLLDAGVAALGGSYASTDIGKITSLAVLDAFRALIVSARARIPAPAPAPAPVAAPAPSAPASTAPPVSTISGSKEQ